MSQNILAQVLHLNKRAGRAERRQEAHASRPISLVKRRRRSGAACIPSVEALAEGTERHSHVGRDP